VLSHMTRTVRTSINGVGDLAKSHVLVLHPAADAAQHLLRVQGSLPAGAPWLPRRFCDRRALRAQPFSSRFLHLPAKRVNDSLTVRRVANKPVDR
jgi:hypothetical protein